jgi:hypothetical protein
VVQALAYVVVEISSMLHSQLSFFLRRIQICGLANQSETFLGEMDDRAKYDGGIDVSDVES